VIFLPCSSPRPSYKPRRGAEPLPAFAWR
jgi:hypothetical protein